MDKNTPAYPAQDTNSGTYETGLTKYELAKIQLLQAVIISGESLTEAQAAAKAVAYADALFDA